MGSAIDFLSSDELLAIAKALFKVTSTDKNRGELIGLCPIHGEKNPSFAYNYLKDAFSCASCKESGDIISLWCHVHGHTDQKEGYKAFLAEYKNDDPGAPRKPKQKKSPVKKAPVLTIPEEVFQNMAPLPSSWVEKLEKNYGWSAKIIKDLDLRQQTHWLNKETGQVEKINGRPQRIVLPVRDDKNEKIHNLRLYKPGAKQKKIISWGRGYGSARLYPSPALLKSDIPILLCEGESDTNCARSHDFNAITQTSKLTKWPDDHKKPFKDRDVIICYDADQPGTKYAIAAAESLTGTAKTIRLLEWPDFMGKQGDGTWPKKHGQDLTDFFLKHKKSASDLLDLIDQAPLYQPGEGELEQGKRSYEFFKFNEKSGRWSFRPRFLANRILETAPLMFDPGTGLLYRWGGQHWQEYFEETIKKQCLHFLGDDSTIGRVNDATTQAMLLSTIPFGQELNANGSLICLQNGMLDLKKLELTKHSKDFYCTYKLDVDFNPSTKKYCKRWLAFLDETIQSKNPILQIQEFFGYCLTRDTKYAKALFALGPGADGKSVLLKILRKMCGPQNCSAVSFRDMEDQFYRSALYNKLLNISTEVGAKAMESQYFKAITTGDPIMAAFKNKTPFEFLPCCKLAFAANKLPRVLDNSDGFFRRVLPISFKKQFFGKDRDTSLEDDLDKELSEIFQWALVGLHRLWDQGGFTECEETDNLLLGYKRLNNPILCFVEDVCEIGETTDHKVKKDSLYRKYKNYCSRRGYTQMHYQNFFRELKTAISSLRDYRPREDGKRENYVKGLLVNDPSGLTGDNEEN